MNRAALMPLSLRAVLLAACLTSSAHAAGGARPGGAVASAEQPLAPTGAAIAAPAVQTTPAPAAPVQLIGAAASDSGVNPFNGKPLSYEAMLRELDLQKVRTALLEENLRATNLNAEIQAAPTRKAAEAAQAQTQIAREKAQAAAIEREAQGARQAERASADSASKGAVRATAKKTKTNGAGTEDAQGVARAAGDPLGGARPLTSAPAVPSLPAVELVSIVVTPKQRSVLVSIGGNVVPLSEGESVPQMGLVKIVDADTVIVGSQVLRVKSATLSRLHIPEPQAQLGMPGPGAAGYVNPALFASTLAQGTAGASGPGAGALPPPVPGAATSSRAVAGSNMPTYVSPRPAQ